jgi:hypothetical protein
MTEQPAKWMIGALIGTDQIALYRTEIYDDREAAEMEAARLHFQKPFINYVAIAEPSI